MNLSKEDIQAVYDHLKASDRFGNSYVWPEDHRFGKFERACDEFMFQLEQVPPFSWAKTFVVYLSRLLKD